MGRRSSNYPLELRERAVGMVAEVRPDHPSEWAAVESVAQKLGIGSAQTLMNWIRKAQVDSGERPGLTSGESAENRRLRAENRELKRANEILKAASISFAAELDRVTTKSEAPWGGCYPSPPNHIMVEDDGDGGAVTGCAVRQHRRSRP